MTVSEDSTPTPASVKPSALPKPPTAAPAAPAAAPVAQAAKHVVQPVAHHVVQPVSKPVAKAAGPVAKAAAPVVKAAAPVAKAATPVVKAAAPGVKASKSEIYGHTRRMDVYQGYLYACMRTSIWSHRSLPFPRIPRCPSDLSLLLRCYYKAQQREREQPARGPRSPA